jgi:DNA-binding transcriptional LysR family regulator
MHQQLRVENSVPERRDESATMKQLQGLLAFVEIAAAGSLAAAARRLEVTPAAVSKNLLRLEAQLGVRLVQRSTRRLRLTDEGERFLANAREALRLLDGAVAEVSQSSVEPAGRVRLSVGVSFGRRWVLPALPALALRHPQLQVEVDLDNRPVDLLAEGYDIGVRGGLIDDSSLVARRVCALPVALLASPGHLRRHGVPQTLDELAQHRCVVVKFQSGVTSLWRFFRSGSGRGARQRRVEFHPQAQLSVSDAEAVLDLALADAGIVQAGLHHAMPYLRSGRLKLVMPELHDPGEREIVLHYPHRQYLAPRVRVVVEALLAHLAQASDLHMTPQRVRDELPQAVAVATVVSATRR